MCFKGAETSEKIWMRPRKLKLQTTECSVTGLSPEKCSTLRTRPTSSKKVMQILTFFTQLEDARTGSPMFGLRTIMWRRLKKGSWLLSSFKSSCLPPLACWTTHPLYWHGDPIWTALGSNCSPGIDGITASFFKCFWHIVGPVVCMAMNNNMPPQWKETLIVLKPTMLTALRTQSASVNLPTKLLFSDLQRTRCVRSYYFWLGTGGHQQVSKFYLGTLLRVLRAMAFPGFLAACSGRLDRGGLWVSTRVPSLPLLVHHLLLGSPSQH